VTHKLYGAFVVTLVAVVGWGFVHETHGVRGLLRAPWDARWPIWLAMVPWLAALLLVRSVKAELRRRGDFSRALEPGMVAMADGDAARAAEVFASVANARGGQQPDAILSARACEATARLACGQFDEAERLLVAVEAAAGGAILLPFALAATCERALIAALRGKLEDAQKLSEATMKRFATALEAPTVVKQRLALVNAIIAARTDRAADALRVLESRWPMIVQGGGSTLRLAVLVRGLLAASTSGPRDAAHADRWIAAARALGAEAALPLTSEWPAMTTFARASGLRGA